MRREIREALSQLNTQSLQFLVDRAVAAEAEVELAQLTLSSPEPEPQGGLEAAGAEIRGLLLGASGGAAPEGTAPGEDQEANPVALRYEVGSLDPRPAERQ